MSGHLCECSLIGVCDAGLQYWSLLPVHTYTPSRVNLGLRVSGMQSLHLGSVTGLRQWITCSHAGALYLLHKYYYMASQGNSVCVLRYIGWEES